MWQLSDTTATCSCNAFTASLDLQRPDGGLRQIAFAHQPLPNASCLEARLNPAASCPSLELQDAYQQGNDVVATYASQAKGVHPRFRWRATPVTASGRGEALMMEMLISIHADRLDTDPAVHIQCRLPAQSCQVLQAPNKPATHVLHRSEPSETVNVDCGGASRAFLFHVANPSLRFGLVFPTADVIGAELAGDSSRELITSRVSFFDGRLEKGVLRRTQLRLIAAPAEAADDLLATQWAGMMMAAPPLST
ncbi:MAG: hypothetical protein ACQESR_00235 [Planctomycetota bacterium]